MSDLDVKCDFVDIVETDFDQTQLRSRCETYKHCNAVSGN